MAKSGARMTVDHMAKFVAASRVLETSRVMVGVPAENEEREDEWAGTLSNSDIGYLMENGIPEHNVPARPHLVPGVKQARPRINDYLRQAARLAYDGKSEAVTRALHAAGMAAVTSVKSIIRAGIPPPLSERTLRGRASRGRKGAARELKNRAAGLAASLGLAKPLIDTGQYLASITHVIRRVSGRK